MKTLILFQTILIVGLAAGVGLLGYRVRDHGARLDILEDPPKRSLYWGWTSSGESMDLSWRPSAGIISIGSGSTAIISTWINGVPIYKMGS